MYNTKKLSKAVRRYMDVSTAHITPNDDIRLREQHESPNPNCPLLVDALPYGHRVHIDTDELNSSVVLYLTRVRTFGFSEALCDLVRVAYQLGCDFIVIDGAAPIFDGVPTFDQW